MKQTIEISWSIGDICWSILSRSVKEKNFCDGCKSWLYKNKYIKEVRECEIDTITVTLSEDEPIFLFSVGFDIDHFDDQGNRFTYGASVSNVYSSREEAEAALKFNEQC